MRHILVEHARGKGGGSATAGGGSTATWTPSAPAGLPDLLAGIGSSGIGSVYLGYRRGDVPHSLNGAGVVIPSSEGRRIDGMTWVSSKWPARAPQDLALLRVFFGGPATRETLDLDDAVLLALVRGELAAILGVQAAPLFQYAQFVCALARHWKTRLRSLPQVAGAIDDATEGVRDEMLRHRDLGGEVETTVDLVRRVQHHELALIELHRGVGDHPLNALLVGEQ